MLAFHSHGSLRGIYIIGGAERDVVGCHGVAVGIIEGHAVGDGARAAIEKLVSLCRTDISCVWRRVIKHRITLGGICRTVTMGVIVREFCHLLLGDTAPVGIVRLGESGVEHIGIERRAVARLGGSKLYVIIGSALATPQHGVGNDGIVATVDTGRASVGHTIGDDAGTITLVVGNGHLGDGATTIHIDTASLCRSSVVGDSHGGAGEFVFVVSYGVVDIDGNTATHTTHTTEDSRAAEDQWCGSSAIGVRTVYAHTTAIAIGGADAERLAVGDAAVLYVATAIHIDAATIAAGNALAHKTVKEVCTLYHIHTTAIGIVRSSADVGVVGITMLDDTSLEHCRLFATAIGIGATISVETVGGEGHHMIAVAIECGIPLLFGGVPRKCGCRRQVAGEDGGVGVDIADRTSGVLRALVLARLRTGKTAIHLDASRDFKRHIEGATARRLRALGRGVGALGYPHLARETVVHQVVDGILYVRFGLRP